MGIFGRRKTGSPDWPKEARQFMVSVVGFLNERSERRKISIEEHVLERKLIFLLDDLRVAIKKNDPSRYEELIGEIDTSWIELWDLRRGRKGHE